MKQAFYSWARPRAQRGVVLILSLIILVVLLGASAALVRSFDTSLFVAGNLAFKRDMSNRGEIVMPAIATLFRTGALSTAPQRANHTQGLNYRANLLPSNPQGIPNALLTDAAFNAIASNANDLGSLTADPFVRVRYVIDRLCNVTGDETTAAVRAQCSVAAAPPASGTQTGAGGGGPPVEEEPLIYRVSIRIDGPRDTQTFLQTTFSR